MSQENPGSGIRFELFGVPKADRSPGTPTSTDSKSVSLEIVGSSTGVSVTVTVTAAWEVPAHPPPGPALLSTTTYRSSPSVPVTSHGRYLSLVTSNMSAETILDEDDQLSFGEYRE